MLTSPGGGDVGAVTSVSRAASLLAGMVGLTIDASDVCRGDVLVGFPGRAVVDVYQQAPFGWVYIDDVGNGICCRRIGSRVQVIRPESAVDDCPVFGVLRPPAMLELVR